MSNIVVTSRLPASNNTMKSIAMAAHKKAIRPVLELELLFCFAVLGNFLSIPMVALYIRENRLSIWMKKIFSFVLVA